MNRTILEIVAHVVGKDPVALLKDLQAKCVHPSVDDDLYCTECHRDLSDDHECDEDGQVDCDICTSCREHTSFCSVCGLNSCCGRPEADVG